MISFASVFEGLALYAGSLFGVLMTCFVIWRFVRACKKAAAPNSGEFTSQAFSVIASRAEQNLRRTEVARLAAHVQRRFTSPPTRGGTAETAHPVRHHESQTMQESMVAARESHMPTEHAAARTAVAPLHQAARMADAPIPVVAAESPALAAVPGTPIASPASGLPDARASIAQAMILGEALNTPRALHPWQSRS